ncbi:MAG: rRNA maturation RNase YbeY [Pseudomonadota bacterium]
MPQILVSREVEDALSCPTDEQFIQWTKLALSKKCAHKSVYIRLITEPEMQTLNLTYRHKDKSTNILSFPFDVPPDIPYHHLGDLVICPAVVIREADEQGKSADAHWAHMTIHGTLHLQGYDHEDPDEATVMESLEVELLSQIGYANPYRSQSL